MLKVLLIEDSQLLREMLSNILSELDNVKFCGCVEGEAEALQRLEETPVDLVIIDIQLKQGSGIGVLRALSQSPGQYRSPRKVVLTNYSHESMQQRCEQLGSDAFFDKSLHTPQLIKYVSEIAAQHP